MQFRTLANLNQTCLLLRDVTLPVLYETVFYTEWTFGKAWQRTKEQNKGWKHVKEEIDAIRFEGGLKFKIDFSLHLYGPITPSDLVEASKWRLPPTSDPVRWRCEKRRQLQVFDPGMTGIMGYDWEPDMDYECLLHQMSLHRNAKLITDERCPREALLICPDFAEDGCWKVTNWVSKVPPALDIRHLQQDESLATTLQGCAWLIHGEGGLWTKARVTCKAEVLESLVTTYHTLASGLEYEVDICDEINAAEFTAIAEKLAEYLVSDPVRLQKVGWTLGTDPLLVVRKMVGDRLAYNASLTIHVDSHPPRPRSCRLVLSTEIHDLGTTEHPNRVPVVQSKRSYPVGELYRD
ncbi:hypothetical protein QFC24_006472 [Naganishia onofrii]|uniref:Uncharacterized protein n=1 Tax=Naganishia onofrii TaxID=1851511 RepID=A0ACC2X0Y9_9TREE|nr:hypothetical protein QFC24_006472 [Naganishia onofrii]